MTKMATVSSSLRNTLSLTIQLYHSFYQEAKSTFPSLESGIFDTHSHQQNAVEEMFCQKPYILPFSLLEPSYYIVNKLGLAC